MARDDAVDAPAELEVAGVVVATDRVLTGAVVVPADDVEAAALDAEFVAAVVAVVVLTNVAVAAGVAGA